METVRIAGDDAREAILRQGGDIAGGQRLEGRLIPQAARHVATVTFFRTEDGEIHPGGAQHLHEGAQRALIAHVEGAIAQPQQRFHRTRITRCLAGGLQLGDARQVEVRRPMQTRFEREAARIVGGDQVVEHLDTLARCRALLQRHVTAHVDDGIDVLDHHRALLDAGTTGGAGPQGFRLDQYLEFVDQLVAICRLTRSTRCRLHLDRPRGNGLAIRVNGLSCRASMRRGPDDGLLRAAAMLAGRAPGLIARIGRTGVGGIAATGHAHHHVLNQFLGIERLTGRERRAHRFTAPALHAGIEAQQLTPVEVGRLADAQRCLGVGQVQRQQCAVADAGTVTGAETCRTPMEGQMQRAGEGMFRRPGDARAAAGHADDHLEQSPGDARYQHQPKDTAGDHAADAFRQHQ